MPTFIDYHSMGGCAEDDLKKSQKKPIAEFGVKNLNTFYAVNSGRMFCLLKAPAKYAIKSIIQSST